jgi:hypothetical protein
MAKKQTINETEENSRQSRKEILRARKQEEQQRVIRIAALIVGGILLVILLVAVVNELFIAPQRAVATVNGQVITLQGWRERVKFERAQRIISLEEQLENFNGDVGLVQQFSSQNIVELIGENSEAFGEAILDRMVDEELIRQGAEERGLVPTNAEIDEQIGSNFNYFGGESPPPAPAPTETIVPTPSVTPIAFAGEEVTDESEQPIASAENVPTSTPLPTPTPVSEEAFQQEFNDILALFKDLGVGEQAYREVIGRSLMAERMMDALAEEQELAEEDMHANFFYLVFSDEEQANETAAELSGGEFLTVWNTFRSQPPDTESEDEFPPVTASELVWQTQDGIERGFGADVAEAALNLPLNTPSEVIDLSSSDGEPLYLIIMVTGRELRELAQAELEARKQQLLQDYITSGQLGDIEISELWRSRVPTAPVLDPKFRQPPTPAPETDPSAGGSLDTGGEITP